MNNTMVLETRPSVKPGTHLRFRKDGPAATLKKGIWVYFILLIIEGGLRKWVLPGLATPLLIVRDPVAIWLLFYALNHQLMPINRYLYAAVAVTVIGTISAVLVGHGSLVVALYGARIMLLHFPLLFLIGKTFSREDVIKMGNVILVIAIPMTILIALQFFSPQSAWVNRGIGGEEVAGFQGALGYFRPPATFSFISGTAQFYNLLACFVIYFWFNIKESKRPLLIAATLCLIASIPLSISRTLTFGIAMSVVFALIAVCLNRKLVKHVLRAAVGISIGLAVLSQTSLFGKATDAISARFDNASASEGGSQGVFNRIYNDTFGAIVSFENIAFFGLGQGMGTNAGAKLLTGKSDSFLVAEGEWGRLVGEMGILLGVILIYMRVAIIVKLAVYSFRKIRTGDILPWVLVSYAFLQVVLGQWAQPTSLGFAILGCALIVSALKERVENKKLAPLEL